MPNYGTLQAGNVLTALYPGSGPYYLFNAETPTAPQASIAFNRAFSASLNDNGTTFQIIFASAPTSSVLIQGSDIDVDGDYLTLYTSTSKQFDSYTDVQRFSFYRAKVATQSAGGAITVVAQR